MLDICNQVVKKKLIASLLMKQKTIRDLKLGEHYSIMVMNTLRY